jgi:uncharacterized protein (TIGR02996 family)
MPPAPLPPPRPELLALLDAIKDHPHEDTPRLILADWLDEQDNPLDAERAAFIRAEIARGPVAVRSRTASVEEDKALVSRWLGPVADLASSHRFERGLPVLTIKAVRLLTPKAHPLLVSEAFAFVQNVYLDDAGKSRLALLSEIPEFRHVPGLSLHPSSALGAQSTAKFFGSPNIAGLRQIYFHGVRPGTIGMQALAANPAVIRLRGLWLTHNRLVDGAIVALAASPHLGKLEILDLSDNNIRNGGAEALAASPTLPNLRLLTLLANPLITDVGKRALRDKFGDRVKL